MDFLYSEDQRGILPDMFIGLKMREDYDLDFHTKVKQAEWIINFSETRYSRICK